MKRTTSKYLRSILLHSTSVAVALLIAYSVEEVITEVAELSAASARFTFAAVFPVLLIAQLFVLRRLFNPIEPDRELLNKHYHLSFASQTRDALEMFKRQVQEHLSATYVLPSFTLYVFDWQQNIFLSPENPEKSIIKPGHAVMTFAEYNKRPFCTERSMTEAHGLSDMQLAELMIFMQRNNFICLVPLYTEQAIYGFVFFTLEQIKDSKLFALKSFDVLQPFSRQFGSLLQKILIYDAIVLQRPK